MSGRPWLYVAHPVRTRTREEAALVHMAISRALALGWAPVSGYLLLRDFLSDANPDERAMAIACDESLVSACNAFLLVGERRTEGMKHELALWGRLAWADRLPDGPSPRRAARWVIEEPFTVSTLTAPRGGA